MADPRDPLAAFDDESVETAATTAGIDEGRLREITRSHQENVRDLPGVDDIVYEWRNQFHQDPLVYQEPDVYVLALRDHVWSEFASQLDVTDAELDGLRTLHDTQARSLVADAGRFDSDAAVVLTRP
ncbi:hypothetical protein [Salinibaculum rarum]|uniref:hypothetical protein n=1 Tax=Salinibaculum rarum TaxID=3058903 RepID=UPI00265D9289|nr:hypothetical protein [Salinibaculum sp. KK48]